jgi:hypothetical protein
MGISLDIFPSVHLSSHICVQVNEPSDDKPIKLEITFNSLFLGWPALFNYHYTGTHIQNSTGSYRGSDLYCISPNNYNALSPCQLVTCPGIMAFQASILHIHFNEETDCKSICLTAPLDDLCRDPSGFSNSHMLSNT